MLGRNVRSFVFGAQLAQKGIELAEKYLSANEGNQGKVLEWSKSRLPSFYSRYWKDVAHYYEEKNQKRINDLEKLTITLKVFIDLIINHNREKTEYVNLKKKSLVIPRSIKFALDSFLLFTFWNRD